MNEPQFDRGNLLAVKTAIARACDQTLDEFESFTTSSQRGLAEAVVKAALEAKSA